jgi:Bacterial membrane protein YfhO
VLAIAWLSKHQTLTAALILVLALHVCFFPFIWGDKTLLAGSRGVSSVMPSGAFYGGSQGPVIYRGNDMGASAWVMEADAPLVRYQYLNEKLLPLWNPYQSYGAPLAANMQSQPFNPVYLLFALHPGPRTYNLFILCRFFIAGVCAYLYLRLFLPFVPSLAGGLVCMLSGYHILFFNMPHLSVEVLIPALFLTTERLLRQQSIRNVLWAVLVVFLSIAGGMPESTLLALTFVYAYFLFRVFSGRTLRPEARAHVASFVSVNVAGFALAAFLLAPFIEFLHYSLDVHQVKNVGHVIGSAHDAFGLSIYTYAIPTLFGTAWKTIAPGLGGYTALRDFFGILQVLFVIIAVGGLLGKAHRRLALFFLGAVIVVLLKRYGSPLINWIGYLPLFQVVRFQKYEEPVLAFAISVLCAFGVAQIMAQGISRSRLVWSLAIALLVLGGIAACSLPAVLAAHAEPHQYYLSLAGATAILFLATLLLLGSRAPRLLGPGLLALLVCQLAGNYIYPVYYVLTQSATNETNPYRGAPYIQFLMSNTSANERIFGRDGILHPDWAGGFQLADIRGLDAMYHWKYLRFVRFFLRDEVPQAPTGELVERFTGGGEHTFDTSLKRRLLQLSSVKYLLSVQPFAVDSQVVQEIFNQNRGRLASGREKLVETRQFTIGGEPKAVLYEHPPYDRLPFTIDVTAAKRQFFFSIAMDPAVYDGSQPTCGDGVEFRLEARDSTGRIAPLYSRYIDPKHNLAERKWIEASVDLASYVGQSVTLLFTTSPGPAGDTCMDWAGWGDPHFAAGTAAQPAFRLVYDHEIKVYEYPDHLPRAALFTGVELAADDETALAKLAASSLDIFKTAVVSAKGLDSADIAAMSRLNQRPSERVRGARILSYTSQEVKIEAAVDRPSFLVLNDSDYPGWKVYVDGRRSHWITANYLFRGVLLSHGKHIVSFAYEPASFTIGAAISGAALLGLAGFVIWRKRSRISRVAEPHLVHQPAPF